MSVKNNEKAMGRDFWKKSIGQKRNGAREKHIATETKIKQPTKIKIVSLGSKVVTVCKHKLEEKPKIKETFSNGIIKTTFVNSNSFSSTSIFPASILLLLRIELSILDEII